MGDPDRLLNSISDADDLERELLASIKKADPPFGAKADGWARLSAQIAAVALVGTAHGSAAAATSASAGAAAAQTAGTAKTGGALAPLAVKLLSSKIAVGLAISAVAIGASAIWVHWSGARHVPSIAAPAASAPMPLPVPKADLAAALPAPDPALQLAPDPDTGALLAPTPSADQTRKDRLSAESALLTEARAYLRNGNANAAQQTLNQLRAKFPKGVLRQEREVLAIEVLSARGKKDAARRRAQAFIAAYPESPHSAQLSRFADAP